MKMYKRWRTNGNCGICGEPCEINKLTKKPFARCFKHRLIDTNYHKK